MLVNNPQIGGRKIQIISLSSVWLVFMLLDLLLFSELPGPVGKCLALISRNSQSLLFQTFLLLLSPFLSLLVFSLHRCYTFCNCPIVLEYSVFLKKVFVCFLALEVSIEMSSISEIFFLSYVQSTNKPI